MQNLSGSSDVTDAGILPRRDPDLDSMVKRHSSRVSQERLPLRYFRKTCLEEEFNQPALDILLRVPEAVQQLNEQKRSSHYWSRDAGIGAEKNIITIINPGSSQYALHQSQENGIVLRYLHPSRQKASRVRDRSSHRRIYAAFPLGPTACHKRDACTVNDAG